jgi:hypothetical protein
MATRLENGDDWTCRHCGVEFVLDFEYDDEQPEGYRADYCPKCGQCVHEDGGYSCDEPPCPCAPDCGCSRCEFARESARYNAAATAPDAGQTD